MNKVSKNTDILKMPISSSSSLSWWKENENKQSDQISSRGLLLQRKVDGDNDKVITSDETLYLISDSNTYIYNDKLEKTTVKIPKWAEVKIKETKTEENIEFTFVKASDDTKDYGWCLKKYLYSLSWNPKDNESTYKKVSSAYNDQMQTVDPLENYKKLKQSGEETFDNVDNLYPNKTDVASMDAQFKVKFDKLNKCFNDNGIQTTASAALRHPLRSVIFNYAIKVRDASSVDIIHEANAVCRKYGIPIDWAHLDANNQIDLTTSKVNAKIVCKKFGLGNDAARGVMDFNGKISNHNSGKAVDINLSFSFTKKKKITFNSKDFEIDPSLETGDITDVKSNQLTLLGKECSGLTRAVDTDIIHWSESGY